MIENDKKSYSDVAKTLNLSTYDVMNEYLSWSSQQDWSDQEKEQLITEYNSGKSLQDLEKIFQTRSIIALHSKLNACHQQLTRPLELLPEQAPLCLRATELANNCLHYARQNEDFSQQLQQLKDLLIQNQNSQL